MHFGDTADEGASVGVARSDHRHGMPAGPHAIIEAFTNTSFAFSEALWFDATSPFTNPYDGEYAQPAAMIFDGADSPIISGGFGTIVPGLGIATPAAASGYVLLSQGTGGPDETVHAHGRMLGVQIRARFGKGSLALPTGAPLLSRCVVGGIRTSTDSTVVGWLSNIIDGIYFVCDVDNAGNARWKAATTSNTETTLEETGVSMVFRDSVADFQIFDLTFDGTTVTYFIDGTEVASIDTHLPSGKLCGWGAFMHHAPRLNTNHMVVDHILFQGTRT